MKKILVVLILLLGLQAKAQIYDPVKWTTAVEKISDSQFDLIITATLEKGWHLYAQHIEGDDGRIPTAVTFKSSLNTYQLIGKTIEGEGHTEHDKVFDMVIKSFEKEAVFKQRINLLTDKEIIINEIVNFMVCDDALCLPPTDVDLTFTVKGKAGVLLIDAELKTKESEAVPKKDENNTQIKQPPKSSKNLWSIFLIAFIFGFEALLTLCVFPMIPMTVSFFTKQSTNKDAGL